MGVRDNDFLALLSHELRNPVAAVSGGFELLQKDDFSPEACSQVAPIIADQLRYLSRLLDDLLDIARLRHNKLRLERRPVNVALVLRNIRSSLDYRLDQKDLQLRCPGDDVDFAVWADPIRLRQIIENVLDNAIRFSKPGGQIECTVEADGEEVVLHIRDEGIGISPEFQARVFEPFEQENRDPNLPLAGLGVGLSITKDIVEMHGGRIDFASSGRDLGTTFTVRLPRVNEAVQRDDFRDVVVSPLDLLVVDDLPAIQLIMERILRRLGHNPHIVASGEAAIEQLKSQRFDAVLCDIRLPGIDGYDVARWVRKSSDQLRKIPAMIAVTGYFLPEDRHRSFDAGFDAHLAKPISMQRLTDTFAQLQASGIITD